MVDRLLSRKWNVNRMNRIHEEEHLKLYYHCIGTSGVFKTSEVLFIRLLNSRYSPFNNLFNNKRAGNKINFLTIHF